MAPPGESIGHSSWFGVGISSQILEYLVYGDIGYVWYGMLIGNVVALEFRLGLWRTWCTTTYDMV